MKSIPSSLPPLKVVLVEDSVPVRKRLAALIASIEGVEIVGEAADASTALNIIVASQADVAVVDMHLTGSNGMEVVTDLVRRSLCVVTIMLTNDATPLMREASLAGGADYFFDKTTEFRLALDTIGKLARERQ